MNAIECAEKASDIFVMSDSFIRIRELIDDDSSTIDDIADIITLDPALATTVLKLANSPFFNYPRKIDTISKAVLVLGITEVYNLVIAYFTTQAFSSMKGDKEYLENFWECTVDSALILKFIGHKLGIQNSERLFILGLLHNIGEIVVQQFMPAKVEVCNQFSLDETPWDRQRNILNFTYGECSGELLKCWQIPYSLIEPVRNQDENNFEHLTIESRLLYVAKRIMLLNYSYKDQDLSSLLTDKHLAELEIDAPLIKAANDFCDVERLNILAVLNPAAVVIY